MSAHTGRRRGRWIVLLSACMVLVVAGGLTALTGMNTAQRSSVTVEKDMNGHDVALDPGVELAPQDTVTTDTGQRFRVPSVGLDVDLKTITPTDGQVTPPGFTSAYEIRSIGTTPSHPEAGTVYVVAHALRNGGTAPGNYLTDIRRQRSRLGPGTIVTVAGVDYAVTGARNVPKSVLAEDAATWTNTPNRLVVITCLERADGSPATHNTVITATRALHVR